MKMYKLQNIKKYLVSLDQMEMNKKSAILLVCMLNSMKKKMKNKQKYF